MKHSKLLLLASLPLLLAGCGGNTSSSSPTPTPASSPDAPSTSSGGAQSVNYDSDWSAISVATRSRYFKTITEGSKYESNSTSTFAITFEAESGIVMSDTSTLLPAGGKLTVSINREGYYFGSTYGSSTTHITFESEVDPASLTIENATGARDASNANQVNLTFAQKGITTLVVTPSVDVTVTLIGIVYGYTEGSLPQ